MNPAIRTRLRSQLDELLARPGFFADDAATVEKLAKSLGVQLVWRRFDINGFEGKWTDWTDHRQQSLNEYLPPAPDDLEEEAHGRPSSSKVTVLQNRLPEVSF